MHATGSKAPAQPPSPREPSTEEVLRWLKSQTKPFTFEDLCEAENGTLLLPIYGKIHVRKLRNPPAAVTTQESKVNAILDTQLKKLRQTAQSSSSPYTLKSPRFEMIVDLIKDFRTRPFPVQEAQGYKLKRIPRHEGEKFSLSEVLEALEKSDRRAVLYVLQWFGMQDEAPSVELKMAPEEWLEVQMKLLRLQALPAMSYYEALSAWNDEQSQKHGTDSLGWRLYKTWIEASPFFQLLSQTTYSILPNVRSEVVLKRPAGEFLAEADTFHSFLARRSCIASHLYINHLAGAKVRELKERLPSLLESSEELFCKEPLRPTLLYLLTTISQSYKEVISKDATKLLESSYKLLSRIYCTERIEKQRRIKELPKDLEAPFSLVLSILLLYHTVTLISPSLNLNFQWFASLQALKLSDKRSLLSVNYFIPIEMRFANCSIGSCSQQVLDSIVKIVTTFFPKINSDAFRLSFHRKYGAIFREERSARQLLYYVSLLACNYLERKRDAAKERLHGLVTLLSMLGDITDPARRFLYGLTLFYNTVLLAPLLLAFDYSLFDLFVDLSMEEQTEMLKWWQTLSPAKNDALDEGTNLQALFTRWVQTPFERMLLLSEITADHCQLRPNNAPCSLKTHIEFLRDMEELCSIRFKPELALFALTILPLSSGSIPIFARYREARAALIKFSRSNQVDLPQDYLKQIPEIMGDLPVELAKYTSHYGLPDAATLERDKNRTFVIKGCTGWVVMVPNAAAYSLTPQSLGLYFSRLFAMAFPVADNDQEKVNAQQWATLYNGALREMVSEGRSIRTTLSWNADESALLLEIFWVDSRDLPTTRRIQVQLPIAKAYLHANPSLFARLPLLVAELSQDFPLNPQSQADIPPLFIQGLKTLKCELRKALLGEIPPLIFYDDSKRLFSFGRAANQEPHDCFQVNLNDYEARFRQLLQQPGVYERAFSTRVRTASDDARWDITLTYQIKTERCMGDSDDEDIELKDRNFYVVTLSFSDHPAKSYAMTYTAEPTPILIAWQLALLKESLLH